jgi:hypothetical protein
VRLLFPGAFAKNLVLLLVELGEHTIECRAASDDFVKAQPIEVAKLSGCGK